jgi:hypothetical protein
MYLKAVNVADPGLSGVMNVSKPQKLSFASLKKLLSLLGLLRLLSKSRNPASEK